ncbi:MAG: hypothetical protein HRT61_11325 [Ekhidna sp.]|nr:hypothetical protein [Ekhidna sp.]
MMKSIKVALMHCPQSREYRLIQVTERFDPNDPCVLWVFDSSKIKTAQKIMKNMNIAQVINSSGMDLSLSY